MGKALDALEALYKVEGPDSPAFLQAEVAYQTSAAIISQLQLLREAILEVRSGVGEVELKIVDLINA
jgi:hypothetical protein